MLTVERLSAGYDNAVVLRDVSLTVRAASVVALLGPNGAGKSTLFRALSGLLAVTSGKVIFSGEDVTDQSALDRVSRGLCYLTEGRGIFPSLTVRENLLMWSPPGAGARSIASATQVFPRLGERLRQQAGTLSGGEQQMLALARAFVTEPKLVLVDEASLGLAPVIVDTVFEFLGSLTDRGIALLIAEQYVDRALEISETVYLLNGGRVVLSGRVDELDPEVFRRAYLSEPHPE